MSFNGFVTLKKKNESLNTVLNFITNLPKHVN